MIRKTGELANASTWRALGTSVPVYVTNKTAEGITMAYSMPVWIPLLGMLIVTLNVFLWGGIGIYEAFKWVIA